MTGLSVETYDEMLPGLLRAFHDDRRRLEGRDRRRAIGGGDTFDLQPADRFLLTAVWLRHYPTQECLGYLFGVSDSSALRCVRRCLPILERTGKDSMRLPDPGRHKRKPLPSLLKDTPELAVIVDTFEQRAQRPGRRQRAWYSGKKKAHTLKSQVAVDEGDRVVVAGECRPGRWANLEVFKRSGLAGRLARADDVGALGDLAYVRLQEAAAGPRGATPRRKPRGKDRPAEDSRFNRAFARRRIKVEHAIGRSRRFQGAERGEPARPQGARRPGAGGGRPGQPHACSESRLNRSRERGDFAPSLS